MRAFWLEYKSLCKSFKFLALLLILCSYQLLIFVQSNQTIVSAENQEALTHLSYVRKCDNWLRYWQNQSENQATSRYSAAMIQANLKWYTEETALATALSESFQAKDWYNYTLHQSKKGVLNWEIRGALSDPKNPYTTVLTPQQYFGARWSRFQERVQPFVFKALPYAVMEGRSLPSVESGALLTDYYFQLHENGLTPAGLGGQSPWEFLFNFLRQGLPNALAILTMFMAVSLLAQEKKHGAIKTGLQSPRSRLRYLLRKAALGSVSSISLVAIPQIFTFFILGFVNGFGGVNFPVLLNNNVFQWTVSQDYAYLVRWSYPGAVGLSQYIRGAYGSGALTNTSYVPLWQFLSLVVLGLTCFIVFCTVLGLLLSVIFKNETVAQVATAAVLGLGLSAGRFWPHFKATTWDLFSKAKIISLLEGGQFSTYLSSIVALAVVSIVVFFIAALLFRKQDVAA